MKKQIYSFVLVLVAALFSAAPLYSQEENEEAVDALEKAEAKKFKGLEYEVPELKAQYKSMCDQYLAYLKENEAGRASRQLVVLMDTLMSQSFRQRVDGLVSVGHYFVQNRSEKAALTCKTKLDEMDKAPTQRYVLLFLAEVAELLEDHGEAIKYYDEVLYLEEDNALAFERKAYVSKFRNQEYAISDYKKLLTLKPDEYKAYKHIGDIYYNYATHETYKLRQDSLRAEAIENYRLYFEAAPKTADAIEFRACQRYVETMYKRQLEDRHKDNDSLRVILRSEARRIAQMTVDLNIAPTLQHARLMHAYVFFCDVQNKHYDLARQSRSYITNKLFPDSIYTGDDFMYAASLEVEQEKFLDAIPYYDVIIARYPKYINVCTNVIKIYTGLKRPLDAVPYQETLMASHGANRLPSEDMAYAKLFRDAIALSKDSVQVDTLTKKLASVYEQGINHYKQRLTLDSVQANKAYSWTYLAGLKDLYIGSGEPEGGIPYFSQYLEILGDSATIADQFDLAALYQSVIQNDTTKRAEYIDKADMLFEHIAETMESGSVEGISQEQYYLPWYRRAQLWITDPAAAEEKPKMYYEKALEFIGENEKLNRQRELCAQYLMLYHFKTNNDEECMKYLEIVMICNSNNKVANQILEFLL